LRSGLQGDVCQFGELVGAMAGCSACVSCQWTERPSSLKDVAFKLWDPSNEFLGAWGPTKPDPLPEEWGEDYSWLLSPRGMLFVSVYCSTVAPAVQSFAPGKVTALPPGVVQARPCC
jgi:hypothetical protein